MLGKALLKCTVLGMQGDFGELSCTGDPDMRLARAGRLMLDTSGSMGRGLRVRARGKLKLVWLEENFNWS